MLDQNLINLFSTILGGFLAIIGGFFAIYFTQYMANKAEKRKLTREKIEEAYTLANEVVAGLRSYAARIGREIMSGENLQVDWQFNEDFTNKNYVTMRKLDAVIQLYLPHIKEDLKEFSLNMSECLNLVGQIGITKDRSEIKNFISKVEEARIKINRSISKLIEKV